MAINLSPASPKLSLNLILHLVLETTRTMNAAITSQPQIQSSLDSTSNLVFLPFIQSAPRVEERLIAKWQLDENAKLCQKWILE
jgi:hypothetical protein